MISQPFRSCEMRVTVLRNGTRMPKVVSQLRNTLRNGTLVAKLGVFTLWDFAAVSQLRNEGYCAAKWHSCAKIGLAAAKIPCGMELWLRNWEFSHFGTSQPFRSCEMRVTVLRNGTRVPKVLSQPRNPLRNGTFGAKSGFTTSQCVSQLRNGCSCAAKWHSCAKSGFATTKIFAERGLRLRTGFAAKFRFRRGCEISQTPIFALFLLCFRSVFAPISLRKTSFNFFAIPLDFDHPKTYITYKKKN